MQMNVKQDRITQRDADHRDRVRDAQRDDPLGMWQSEQTSQRNDQVSAVPANHAGRQHQQQTLDCNQAYALAQQHVSEPQRQHGAQAVTD